MSHCRDRRLVRGVPTPGVTSDGRLDALVKLGIVSAGIVVILAGSASVEARAQTDSIGGRIFRIVLDEVANASNLPRLDSTALLAGVRREIRIYTGFGLTATHQVVRLVEHTHGVDGQFGVFWPAQTWMYSPADARRAQEKERAWDARIRAHLDTAYDCRVIKQTRVMRVCWLPERPNGRVAWAQLLARLDSLGVNSIPSPVDREMGADGWLSIVEVRTSLGYRVYNYWSPDSTSADPGERAAAAISTAVWQALKRRLGR